MKKFLLSFFILGLFSVYSINQRNKGLAATSSASSSARDGASSQNNPMASGKGLSPDPNQTNSAVYKNGVYTGAVEDAFYGNVQVQVAIGNGRIKNIVFLKYPNSNYTCIAINTQAMPYLKQEALVSQSANVDIISGATDTSQAFIESLHSALAQAKT